MAHYPYECGLSYTDLNIVKRCCTSKQYSMLKVKATEAMKQCKVFRVCGEKEDFILRKTLVERAWVEQIPTARRKALAKNEDIVERCKLERLVLAILVQRAPTNFIWYSNGKYRLVADPNVLTNKLRNEVALATKEGLCETIKDIPWQHIDGIAEITYPRTYNINSKEGEKEFEEDYKLTTCTSLLKWLIVMFDEGRQVSSDTGKVPFSVIDFASARSKEYLLAKQNEDIDLKRRWDSKTKWASFLKKYNILVAEQDVFQQDSKNKMTEYIMNAKHLLRQMQKYRPQLECEGFHNIWIVKPAQRSRGWGITIESNLSVLKSLIQKSYAVVQKYLEHPLLIHETKFDIRQYFMVTKTAPLKIWMYNDCYLKFSSQKYDLKNYSEAIHLTNFAVQKKYQKYPDQRHTELPSFNMWSLETFKNYLRKKGKEYLWNEVIYPGMRKSIIATMLCCQEPLSDNENRFEIYGCDFILDKDCKPWLLEINGSPDLTATTPVTAEICPAVIEDCVKVVFDRAVDKNARTGNFDCIYSQTLDPFHVEAGSVSMTVYGHALGLNYFYKGPRYPNLDPVYGIE